MLAPTVYDTFNRTVSGGFGTSTSGHSWTATVGADSSVIPATSNTPGLGNHAMVTSGIRICTVGPNVTDSDVRFAWAIDALAVGAALYAGSVARYTNSSNHYYFRIDANTDKSIGWQIHKVVAGSDTSLANGTVSGLTHSITARYWARAKVTGTTLQFKVWSDSTGEPLTWTASITDSAISAAGQVGVRSERPVGNSSGGVDATYSYFTCGPYADAAGKALAYDLEIAWGASLTADPATWRWTPVTPDVYLGGGTDNPDDANRPAITTKFGRSDWAGQAQPSGLAAVLDNTGWEYAAYNPASLNYPNVVRGTPVRERLLYNWVRFLGFANGFTPTWDLVTNQPIVNLSASGSLRRLGQGTDPIRNVLTRYHVAAGAVAVWPFDDGRLSTQASNAVPGGPPMKLSGAVAVGFGIDESTKLPATTTVVTIGAPSPGIDVFAATVNATLSGELHIDMWRLSAPEPDASETQLLVLDLQGGSGFGANVELRARMSQVSPPVTGGYIVLVGGTPVMDSGTGSPGSTVNPIVDGLFHNVHVKFVQSGPNVLGTLYVDGAVADSHTFTTVTLPTLFTTAHIRNSIVAGAGIGNSDEQSVLAVYAGTASPSYTVGTQLYTGESATTRLARLCNEEGVPLLVTGGTSPTTMGRQPADTFLNLLRECEAAEGGQLYDGQGTGLGYITRATRYNPQASLTVDASQEQLSAPFQPLDDDQQTRNKWTVSRSNGSFAVATDTDPGDALSTVRAGVYRDTVTLNLDADDQLLSQASWRVHVGTNEGFRYPTLPLDLFRNPEIGGAWLDVDLLGRVDVTNLPTPHPPGAVSVVVNGGTEAVGDFAFDVQANCSPERPWEVFQLDDNRLGRLDTSGSQLHSSVSSGATTLSVDVTAGPLWLLGGGFDIEIEGEQITVTNVTGAASPQTFTVTRSVNGVVKAHNATAVVKVWRPGVLAL